MSKLVLFLMMSSAVFSSQLISGSASIRLSGPITNEQNQEVQKTARTELKKNLLSWLAEQHGVTVDTSNALDDFAAEQYVDFCKRYTKEELSFQGKIAKLTLLLPFDSAEAALQNHNATTNSRASASWKKFDQALKSNDFQNCYFEGIRTLAAANAHFGPPLIIPESDGKKLVDVARVAVQEIVDKMRVVSSDMIIEGRSGSIVTKPCFLTVEIDSTPLAGVWFTGKLQNGRDLFSKITDENGKISFADLRIPFVSNGTLMYGYLDFGKLIGSPGFISAKHFGIRLKNSQDQSFIIKVNRPIYRLNFNASSVGQIKMPPDFADVALVKKFLKDSCYMQEGGAGVDPDLEVTIHSQVSDYNYDDTEEYGIKTTIHVAFKGLTYDPPISSENTISFEKKYERTITPPFGLYFWEANIKLREIIRKTIDQL